MAAQATEVDLEMLAALAAKASPGPWYVGRFDDEYCMSAISVEAYLPDNAERSRCEVIAATLIQQPQYVNPSDGRELQNAELIAEMRNALPELLRLAAAGKAAGQPA